MKTFFVAGAKKIWFENKDSVGIRLMVTPLIPLTAVVTVLIRPLYLALEKFNAVIFLIMKDPDFSLPAVGRRIERIHSKAMSFKSCAENLGGGGGGWGKSVEPPPDLCHRLAFRF